MSEDIIQAQSGKEFVTKCRALEDQICQKHKFQKHPELSFITSMITDLDIIAHRFKPNKEFIGDVIDLIKKVLSPPIEIKDDKHHQSLRKEYLDFFNKFPWFEDLGKHTIEFFNILSTIVMTDNQSNAHKALHIIHNLNKYFKNLYIKFSHYKPLLDFFIEMLGNFDKIVDCTFYLNEFANDSEPKKDLIEKSLTASKPSKLSLTLLNEFMEVVIFLDQMYKDDPNQVEFFRAFRDPFIFTLAKSYDTKWLKFSSQTKEFFSLKNFMIFLMFQYLHDEKSFQCESLFQSKSNIINMLIINIKHIPSTYWTIKRQFLKFFKDFLIKISKRDEGLPPGSRDPNDDVFHVFKEKILDPKFITKHSDNNIEIFKEFSFLIIEFSIRYLKTAGKSYDQTVIEAILQLLRHPLSYPIEKVECAAEYFMRLTILSIQKDEKTPENDVRKKTYFHNELVEAICDASLERAEYLYNLSLKEEELKTFEDTEEDNKQTEIKDEDDMEVDGVDEYADEPLLEMDYDYMSYTDLKKYGKMKDVFDRDDSFPLIMYSKKLRKRYLLRELNGACKRIVFKVPLYFLRSNSYLYLLKKSLDIMKKLLKAFFIMQRLCKKYQEIDLLVEKNNTLIVLIMLTCCKMPKNDLYETIRTYNNEIFGAMIDNLKFLKDILVPITDPKSKINEMILSCEPKRIDVKHVNKEDLNIFHYTIIGSGLEYVLNHLKFIGKPPYKYRSFNNLDIESRIDDKHTLETITEIYPEQLFQLLEILTDSFVGREVENGENNSEYQSIMHLQSIIFNNLFKIVVNSFRLLKTAECNYVIYLKIIDNILCTYLKKHKKDLTKFKPLLLIIIEHVMHMRKEMGKRKELNDIMLDLPLGIKHLIEYMPFIFEFIQESLNNKDERGAIEILTHWIRVVSNLNDIIDPIIGPTFSEFAADLFEAFYSNYMKKDQVNKNGIRAKPNENYPAQSKDNIYGTIFWLISKLGPKCRIYNDDKIFNVKEDSVNGMKIMFREKDFDGSSSRSQFTYTNFSIPQVEQSYKYMDYVEQTLEFLMPCVLFSVNSNSMDPDLVKRCIKNVLVSESNAELFNESNAIRKYPHSELYDEDPKIHRNRQIRSFELIIRMLFAACLMGGKKVEKVYDEITDRIKSLTCHFVLIYICKNGKLINKIDDEFSEEEKAFLEAEEIEVGAESFLKASLCEINPLIFLDIVCEFFIESYQKNSQQNTTASKIVLIEIFRLLKSFYPDPKDYAIALERLEFMDILIKKLCYLSYLEGIQKKIGCISALRIIIDNCPQEFLKRYNIKIIECQIVIIKNIPLSYGGLPGKLISNLLNALAKKNNFFFDDKEEMKAVVEKVFEYFKDVSCKGRRILEGFLENIRKAYINKLTPQRRMTKRKLPPPENPFPEVYSSQLKKLSKDILGKKILPRKLDYLLEGYSQIENLINEVDVVLHLFKHK